MLVDFHRKVLAESVIKMLKQSVWVNGEENQSLDVALVGWGNAHATCYMEQKKKLETVWKECGDFEAIKSVSKCLKRIGQLFSAATSGVASHWFWPGTWPIPLYASPCSRDIAWHGRHERGALGGHARARPGPRFATPCATGCHTNTCWNSEWGCHRNWWHWNWWRQLHRWLCKNWYWLGKKN